MGNTHCDLQFASCCCISSAGKCRVLLTACSFSAAFFLQLDRVKKQIWENAVDVMMANVTGDGDTEMFASKKHGK